MSNSLNKPLHYLSSVTISLFLILFFTPQAYAVIGLPESTQRIGFAFGAVQMEVADPDGANPDAGSTVPANLIVTDWLPGGNRYWLELLHSKKSYQPTETEVGQNVRYTGFRALFQKNFRFDSSISPWLGAGLSISQTSYKTRHTKTSDGFLLEKFDDRSSNTIGFMINAVIDWELNSDWLAGIKADQTFNFGHNLNARGVAMYFLYLY